MAHVQDQPLPGCNIYIEGTFSGTTSQNNGYFEFEYDVKDSSLLKVDFLGFEPVAIQLTTTSQLSEINITLKEEFNTLNAVTVTAGLYGSGEGEKAVVLKGENIKKDFIEILNKYLTKKFSSDCKFE